MDILKLYGRNVFLVGFVVYIRFIYGKGDSLKKFYRETKKSICLATNNCKFNKDKQEAKLNAGW